MRWKYILNKIDGRREIVEGKTNEDLSVETTQNETEKKYFKKTRVSANSGITSYIYNIIYVQLESLKEKGCGGENMFEEIKKKNSNLMKIINP